MPLPPGKPDPTPTSLESARATTRASSCAPARKKGIARVVQVLPLLAAGLPSPAAVGEIATSRDADTGLRAWTWSHEGISLKLLQLLPDQTRAFFLGRGFPSDAADRVGRSCVLQTIFRNDGTHLLEYDLRNWSILFRSKRQPLRTREVWDPEWEERGIEESARIAFRWSLLPTVQRFEPGDYNWGMTSFGLAPGERFDLALVVEVDGEPVTARIPSLVCATDR